MSLVTFSKANLPAVSSLATSLRTIQSEVGAAGVVILKMDKTGHWVFGADQTEVEDDSLWAINPFSFVHGFIAWGDGEVLGEYSPYAMPFQYAFIGRSEAISVPALMRCRNLLCGTIGAIPFLTIHLSSAFVGGILLVYLCGVLYFFFIPETPLS